MIERDKLHYNTTKIDGYNLPFNFIISEREAGKSTAIVLDKIYKAFIKYGYHQLWYVAKSYISQACILMI